MPDNYHNAVDLSPFFVLFTMALYTFMEKEIKIRHYVVGRIIGFAAKHSFLVYMLHWYVLAYITPKLVCESQDIISYLLNVLVTLLVSIFLAVVLDALIIFPIQRMMNRMAIRFISLT